MDKENGAISEEMKDLRTKTSKEEGVAPFKKHIFGGIREKEVEEHIASITQQFNRAEEAYKDRIDEFATQTEMLMKKCDDIAEQLKSRTDELNETRQEILSGKNENNVLIKTIKEYESKIAGMETKESERIQNERPAPDLMKENDLLKEELFEIQQIRDQLAGENAVIKKQIKNTEDLLANACRENAGLLESAAMIRSASRQNEMKKSLALHEYSEKQQYSMNQAAQKTKELMASIEEMRNDLYSVNDSLEERK